MGRGRRITNTDEKTVTDSKGSGMIRLLTLKETTRGRTVYFENITKRKCEKERGEGKTALVKNATSCAWGDGPKRNSAPLTVV